MIPGSILVNVLAGSMYSLPGTSRWLSWREMRACMLAASWLHAVCMLPLAHEKRGAAHGGVVVCTAAAVLGVASLLI